MNRLIFLTLIFCGLAAVGCKNQTGTRTKISLNGQWLVEEGKKDIIPEKFSHKVVVPGLITLSEPAFVNAAPPVPDRDSPDKSPNVLYTQTDSLREAYWYKRTISIPAEIPETVILKIGKAMFGTKVFVNGTPAGEHLPCFTPGYFDLHKFVHPGDNELVIMVGSSRSSIPDNVPDGFDYEKQRYISGIYDDVDLILTGTPFIRNVQVAPNIEKNEAMVQVTLGNYGKTIKSEIEFKIKEYKSGKIAGTLKSVEATGETVTVRIPVSDCRLWSPEDPFLYTLEVSTPSDSYSTRFGMRQLTFDNVTHKAILNGKPYFLRGTNITLYRFFEDTACGSLPWDYDWVRKMHRKFRNDMFWNSYRNCIGFPPEEWYNIADDEGFLIQDEFPIWYGAPSWNKWVKNLDAANLATEYREWMEERWNHPSVVIWDGDNETLLTSPAIDSAISAVRHLDLSGRSWDNSYSTARENGDIFESHPYHFQNASFRLSDIAKADTVPQGNNSPNPGKYPVIINEYGWLWLNRDGSTTTLTRQLYENMLGKSSSTEKRREIYARYMAAETEFWRSHRQAAGVLHFTALGYDRPDGQTSDNWINIKDLVWEPEFLKYVRDSFCPLGLMADFWDQTIKTGEVRQIPVVAINDLGNDWSGTLKLKITMNQEVKQQEEKQIKILAYGRTKSVFMMSGSLKPGNYMLEASLVGTPYGTIRSIRDFTVK